MISTILRSFIDEAKNAGFCKYTHPIFQYLRNESTNATILLTIGTELYRARKIDNQVHDYLGISKNYYGFDASGSFAPPVFRAQRANREGEKCLYCADNSYYALVEVAPEVGENVSLATLKVSKFIKIFDLTLFHKNRDMSDEKRQLFIALSEMFSKPISKKEDPKDYYPTQIIADFIRTELHCDGVAYSSSLCPELNRQNYKCTNYAIFNYSNCAPIKSNIIQCMHKYGDSLSDYTVFEQIDDAPCRLSLIGVIESGGGYIYDFKFPFGTHTIPAIGDSVVGLNNNVFVSTSYERYSLPVRILSKGTDIDMYIGEGMHCFFDKTKAIHSFTPPSMLNNQINDLTFFLSAVDEGKFWIGDRINTSVGGISLPISESQRKDIEGYKKQLSFAKMVKATLRKLHITSDLNMQYASDEDKRLIDILIHGILFGGTMNTSDAVSHLQILKIQNMLVYLIFEKIGNQSYRVYDFFAKVVPIQAQFNDMVIYTPQTSILTAEQLVAASNIDFDFLSRSSVYAELYDSANPDLPFRANYDVWNMISAYYLSDDSRFLRSAEAINNWVKTTHYSKLGDFPTLNAILIKKISKRMNTSDFECLSRIIEASSNYNIQAFACILLGKDAEALQYYNQLDDEAKERFNAIPMCKLWNRG